MSYLIELLLAVFSRVMLFARVQTKRIKPQITRGVNIFMIIAIIMPMTFVPTSAQVPVGAQVEINQGSIEKDLAIDSLSPENEVYSAYQDPKFAHPEPRTVAVPEFPEDALEPVIYLANRYQMGRTYNFYDESPTWENITPPIQPDPEKPSREINDFVLSPKDPFNVAFIATEDYVYRTTNLSAATPTWEAVLATTISGEYFRRIIFPAQGNRILVTSFGNWLQPTSTYYISDDGGDTWEVKDQETVSGYDVRLYPSLTISPDGTIYAINYYILNQLLIASHDDGDSWELAVDIENCGSASTMFSPESDLVYFSGGGEVCRWKKGDASEAIISELPFLDNNAGYENMQEYPDGGLVMEKSFSTRMEMILYDYENTPSTHKLLTYYEPPTELEEGESVDNWGERGSALFVAPNTDFLGWASRTYRIWYPPPVYTHFIISSTDGGGTWHDATGNWGDEFGNKWQGSAGSSYSFGTVYFRSPSFSLPDAADAQYACASGNCPVTTTVSDCQENVGNPVNTATGNHSWASTDISIPVPAGQLSFTRSYSTFNARDVAVGDVGRGVLSAGWYHNYEVQLLFPDDPGGQAGQVVLHTPGGSRYGFNDLGDGVYEPEPGLTGELSYDEVNDTYSYRNTHGDGYDFDGQGRVTTQVTATGQRIEMTYDPTSGQLSQVAEPNEQRYLTFGYYEYTTGEYRLTSVSDHTSRTVQFGYEDFGPDVHDFRLSYVVDVLGNYWYYTYASAVNPEFAYFNHYLQARHQPTTTASGTPETLPVLMKYVYGYAEANPDPPPATLPVGNTALWLDAGQITGLSDDDPVTTWPDQSGNSQDVVQVTAGIQPTYQTGEINGLPVVDFDGSDDYLNMANLNIGNNTTIFIVAENTEQSSGDDENRPLLAGADGVHDPYSATGTQYALGYKYADSGGFNVSLGNDTDEQHVQTYQAALEAYELHTFSKEGTDAQLWRNGLSVSEGELERQVDFTYGYNLGADPNLAERSYLGGIAEVIVYNRALTETERQQVEAYLAVKYGLGVVTELEEYKSDLGNTYIQTLEEWNAADERILLIDYDDPDGIRVEYGEGANAQVEYYTYDYRGTLIEKSSASGEQAKAYDINYRPIATQDELGNVTALTWSEDGVNLEDIEDALGNFTDPNYDSTNNLDDITDARGNFTDYSYDGTLLDDSTDALGNFTDYEYYDNSDYRENYLKNITDALGNVTHYDYDQMGQVTDVTRNYDPTKQQNEDNLYNIVTEYQYDQFGNRIATIDTNGIITRTYYDFKGRPVTIVRNLTGQSIVTTTPPSRSSSTAEENIRTDTLYDINGNVVATVNPAGIISATFYDELNRPVLSIQNLVDGSLPNPEQNRETFLTTLLGSTYSPPGYDADYPDQNIHSETYYDEFGNVIAVVDNDGIVTRTYYDERNRPIVVVRNLTQSIGTATPPARSADPEQNIRTDTFYDAVGNVVATIDPLGKITVMVYDALNRPIRVFRNFVDPTPDPPDPFTEREDFIAHIITDVAAVAFLQTISHGSDNDQNLVTETLYDEVGNVIATVDPKGIVTRTYYDELNRPYATVRNLTGQSVETETPPTRNVYNPQDPNPPFDENIRTDTVYDEVGNVIATIDNAGVVTRTYYDELNRPYATVRNLSGQTIEADSPPARVAIDPQNPPTTDSNIRTDTVYDASGRVVATIDPMNIITAVFYDDLSRQILMISNLVDSSLDPVGDPQGIGPIISASGYPIPPYLDPPYYNPSQNVRVETYYDVNGNPIASVENPGLAQGGTVNRTYYDDLNRPVTVVRNLGLQSYEVNTPPVWESYDPEFPDISIGQNIRTDTIYDASGNVWRVYNDQNIFTEYLYDALNRQTSVQDPELHETSYKYDAVGNRIQTENDKDIVTKFDYDGMYRLSAVTENYIYPLPEPLEPPPAPPFNVRTEYSYDLNGNREEILDARSHTTSFGYDALNRLTSETDALSNTSAYIYDEAGNRELVIDANEETIIYAYDALNRLVGIDYPSPDADISFTYDPLGRRISMTDGVGTTSWEYDELSRVKTVNDPFGDDVAYTYTHEGDIGSITYPDYPNDPVGYKYDALHRLQRVTSWDDSQTWYYYDAASRLRLVEYPNDVSTTYSYYDNNWLYNITHENVETETLASYTYSYDEVGNRNGVTETLQQPDGWGDYIFADSFESGDLGAWEDPPDDGGGVLSVSTTAAMGGVYGMQAILNNDAYIGVYDDTPEAETRYRARFYFDPNSASIEDDEMGLLGLYSETGGYVGLVLLRQNNGEYEVQAQLLTDNITTEGTEWLLVSNGRHAIEIDWRAASVDGADDGGLTLWIDGQELAAINGIDNDTYVVDRGVLGAGVDEQIEGTSSGTLYFDAFVSRRQSYIGLDPNIFLDHIFSDGFEGGLGWSYLYAGNRNVNTMSEAAAMEGIYGMQIMLDEDTKLGVYNNTPFAEKRYRVRFYFDPNSAAIEGDEMGLLGLDSGTDEYVGLVLLRQNNGEYEVQARLRVDGGATWDDTGWIPITDGRHAIEIDWRAASGDGANDGGLTLWIDGDQEAVITGIDNDTYEVNSGELGVGIGSGFEVDETSSGPMYFDAFVSHRQSYIDLDPAIDLNPIEYDQPTSAILDDFDRADGPIGSNWAGQTTGFAIASNQLDVVGDGSIFWSAALFSSDQEAYVTLVDIDPNGDDVALLLKVQSSLNGDLVGVLYDQTLEAVQVWTAESSVMTQRGADISVTFSDGDVLGAVVTEAGAVEVYQNGNFVATRDITAWPYYDEGGYIGLYALDADETLLDDFGGGDHSDTPDPTSTPTQTPTVEPTPTSIVPSFPDLGLLDDFNRTDGPIGSNWSGQTTGFAIASNQLDAVSDAGIFWSAAQFGPDQVAYIDLSQIDTSGDDIALLLKVQSALSADLIAVLYDQATEVVQVWTADNYQMVQHGADIPFTFSNGDQLGAIATENGVVEVYQNGTLIATRDVSAWAYYDDGGYIGLYALDADDTVFDDFGGGTLGGQATATPTPTATTTGTPTLTLTVVDTPTDTPEPTLTNTPEYTATPTETPADTPTPTETPQDTSTPTFTPNPTPTPTETEVGGSGGGSGMLGYEKKHKAFFSPVSLNLKRPSAYGQLPAATPITNTIVYDYDPLNRLIEATYDFSEGDDYSFEYEYDAVGNRTELTTSLAQDPISYVYDEANRLDYIFDGTTTWDYTFDANGNLKSDGVNTYNYYYSNRLKDVTDSVDTYAFAYNGLGDRLSQTVNAGTPTQYTLDLNAGLTQVLSDGTTTYLYGNGRVAEYSGTEWAYYLPDALGSVRQITDATGAVTYTQTFKPYGEVLTSAGTAGSNYGFAGEWADETGMQYLRARYYSPETGRFVSRDTWAGDYHRPQSLNKWGYVEGNPVNYTDPSGLIPYEVCQAAEWNIPQCRVEYNVSLDVQKPSSLQGLIRIGSQYISIYHNQYTKDYDGLIHYNLCGQLAAQAIIETALGHNVSIDWIWSQLQTAPSTDYGKSLTGAEEWVNVFNSNKGLLSDWSAKMVWADWRWQEHQGRKTQTEILSYLEAGYVMVAVTLDKNTGRLVHDKYEKKEFNPGPHPRYVGHFVDVAAVDQDKITIYNPYTNTYQEYDWQSWTDTDGAYVVITSP